MPGPLQQMTESPASTLVPSISGGNPVLSDMFKTMLDNSQKRQGYLEQQREAYNRDMEQYAQQVEASRMPENNEAGRWGSMASAASSIMPTVGSEGALLAGVGGAYGKRLADEQSNNLRNQAELTKTRQAEVRALEARDQNAAMIRAMMGRQGVSKGYEFRKNSDGTTTAFSKDTGAPTGTYGPQDIAKISALTQTLAKAAFEKGEYSNLDEALNWAQGEALKRIGQMHASVGNRTAPLGGDIGGLPTTPGIPPKDQPAPTEDQIIEKTPEATFKFDVSKLSPEDRDMARRIIGRYKANPNEGTLRQTEKMLSTLFPEVQLPKKDVQAAEEKKKYGEKIGGHMADVSIDLQKTGAAANNLMGDLNTLETLFKEHGDTIPEGAGGDILNTIKSGLKTFGVEVKGQGAADLVKSIATRQALKARTADGDNLLPGAMSNYEDKLLQAMSPGLLMSQEGRLLALQVAKAQLKMRVDLATKAREYIQKNGRLDEGWFNVAADEAKKNPFLNEKRIQSLEKYVSSLNQSK